MLLLLFCYFSVPFNPVLSPGFDVPLAPGTGFVVPDEFKDLADPGVEGIFLPDVPVVFVLSATGLVSGAGGLVAPFAAVGVVFVLVGLGCYILGVPILDAVFVFEVVDGGFLSVLGVPRTDYLLLSITDSDLILVAVVVVFVVVGLGLLSVFVVVFAVVDGFID